MGAIDENTLVVTTVRDEQVLPAGRIPLEKMLKHDVPVDVICTPTQVGGASNAGVSGLPAAAAIAAAAPSCTALWSPG
jgi:hypothetical protein